MSRYKNGDRWSLGLSLCLILLFLAACGGGGSGGSPPATSTGVAPVNGFGSAANHVHSLLALPPHVLVLATHYGIFRSPDSGATWKMVAAGHNQPMEGLMTYSLVASPLNPQRLYVLSLPAVSSPAGIPGLYTSADQGRTWRLASKAASLTSSSLFLAVAGNDTPTTVYIYIPALGAEGLRVSRDAGQHFSSAGTLPFARIQGLRPIPGAAGQLLAYGTDGIARSTDGGKHWRLLKNIDGGINDVTVTGPHRPIYAAGDAGIYASLNGGATFQVVDGQSAFASLNASPAQRQVIYGETGVGVYHSVDGGHTWNPLPTIKGNLAVLAADPEDASTVYLSLSYPTAVYRLGQKSVGWLSVTPQA